MEVRSQQVVPAIGIRLSPQVQQGQPIPGIRICQANAAGGLVISNQLRLGGTVYAICRFGKINPSQPTGPFVSAGSSSGSCAWRLEVDVRIGAIGWFFDRSFYLVAESVGFCTANGCRIGNDEMVSLIINK